MLGLVGHSWGKRIVSEIDSALNKWVDTIPDHRAPFNPFLYSCPSLIALSVQWNPHQENPLFFNQSALLNSVYYLVQIYAHRPFILSQNATSPLSSPSLCICTAAARASSHIMDIRIGKGDMWPLMTTCAFSSGIVLLLNIWGVKKVGVRANPALHMQDVFKCMRYLEAYANR